MRPLLLAALAVVAAPAATSPAFISAVWAQFAPEPPDLWRGPMHGATPATVKGAKVIDARELAEMMGQQPLAIDVANLPPRPEGQSADKPWVPIHLSVPGAIWLPGAGSGTRDPAFAAAFSARVAAATGGDKGKPIVTFCHPQRWGSWNAARRLVLLGYTNVSWYPGGAEGWAATRARKPAFEDPQWKAAGFDQDSAVTLTPQAAGK